MYGHSTSSHWSPLPSVYRDLPDCGCPLIERFAIDLHFHTPFRTIPDLPVSARLGVWERQPHELREFFRERARRLMRGDLTVLPASLPPGYGAWQAVLVRATGEWIDAPLTIERWG